MAILGIDIDGVLANFTEGFRARLVKVTGRDLIPFVPSDGPPCWDWVTHYGYTPEEETATWRDVLRDPMFWFNLEPYACIGPFLEETQGHDRYFITSRPGNLSKWQTERWLEGFMSPTPTVLIAKDAKAKAYISLGLGVTHFLDDRPENCEAVRKLCPSTKVYLVDTAYNRYYDYPKIQRIQSPLDLIGELDGD